MSKDAVARREQMPVRSGAKGLNYVVLRLAGLGMLYLIYLTFVDLMQIANISGSFVGGLSVKWFSGMAVFGLVAVIGGAFCGVAVLQPGRLIAFYDRQKFLDRIPTWARWTIAGGLVLLPSVLILGEWGKNLTMPSFRNLLLLWSGIVAGILVSPDAKRALQRIALAFLVSASIFAVAKRLVILTDYPFKLFWSEGNRLWDYSLYFALDRYALAANFTLPSYLAPGRHALWGLPYLVPGIGIAAVRLWDHLLWLIPYFVLGWLFYSPKRAPVSNILRIGLSLWSLLYLAQGGIFAPLILSVTLVAWGFDSTKLWRVVLIAAAASFYAGISRWTWFVAPAMYASLWMLLDDPQHRDRNRRLKSAVIVGLGGLLGGLGAQAFMSVVFPRPESVFSTALGQPLLWYRLLPNPTNPQGILLELLLAVGPLLVLVIWFGLRARSGWGWLEWGALSGGLLATLLVGLAASVKIGGGNNIHNLDMFLMLVFLAVGWAGMNWARDGDPLWPRIPAWIQGVAVLALVMPAFHMLQTGGPRLLPSEKAVEIGLDQVRELVEGASGEVLFIDQRQLLTFGNISGVELFGEYELKNMMNQAMGGNDAYFNVFVDDLREHRFALIVSDPLPKFIQASDYKFGEENDAWLLYVAEPLQLYYEDIYRFGGQGPWIMAPRK